MAAPDQSDDVLWRPAPGQVEGAQLTAFMRSASERAGSPMADYDTLWRWSIEHPEAFWPAVWDFCGVRASRRWDAVLEHGDRMPGATWFRGARLNFTENLLRRDDPDRVALVWRGEDGARRVFTRAELYHETARLAGALRRLGVGPGDRVAGFLPNCPEAVIAMLAAASLGATWSSCSPDFGIQGVLDRFGQIRPKVLFTADGYRYNGKPIDSIERIRGVLEQLEGVERVVLVPFLDPEPATSALPNALRWQDFRRTRPSSSSPSCPSTTRSTSSIPRAPPGCRSASSTAPAAPCCSISRSTGCIPTSGPVTRCSTSPPAAG